MYLFIEVYEDEQVVLAKRQTEWFKRCIARLRRCVASTKPLTPPRGGMGWPTINLTGGSRL